MSKHLFLTVLSTGLFFSYSFGALGCRTGNDIYTIQKPGAFISEGTQLIPIYYASSGIHIRNGVTDTQCGILRIKSNNYTTYPGTSSNMSSKCAYDSNPGDQGTLVDYLPSDSNCMALPLDDYMPYLIGSIGFLGFIIIRKKSSVYL